MKNISKYLLLFFMMLVSFSLTSSDFVIKEIHSVASIQASSKEEFVLVSNNLQRGEIYSIQEENNQNSVGNSPQLISFNFEDHLFSKNNTRIYGSFIHNLSTNNQKVQQIRAP